MAEKITLCDTDVMIDYFDVKNARNEKTVSIINNKISLDNIVISTV